MGVKGEAVAVVEETDCGIVEMVTNWGGMEEHMRKEW